MASSGFPPQKQDGGENPFQGVGEIAASDEAATAPPIGDMEAPPGYEGMTFEPTSLPPPKYTEVDENPNPGNRNISEAAQITDEQVFRKLQFKFAVCNLEILFLRKVHDALVQFVASNCCYGKAPLEAIAVKNILMNSSFHVSHQPLFIKSQLTNGVLISTSSKLSPNVAPLLGSSNLTMADSSTALRTARRPPSGKLLPLPTRPSPSPRKNTKCHTAPLFARVTRVVEIGACAATTVRDEEAARVRLALVEVHVTGRDVRSVLVRVDAAARGARVTGRSRAARARAVARSSVTWSSL